MAKYLKAAAAAALAGVAAAAPALDSPWQEIAVAVIAVGAAVGLSATHAAAKRTEAAVNVSKDQSGSA